MSRFVRPSKYRHVFGTAAKRDGCYDNLRITNSAWDTNLVKVNPRYLSVNWNAGGGGAFAVIPLEYTGKLPLEYPLFSGHSGPVLDTDFSPFNDNVIASASEDTRAMIWVIPEDLVDLEESIDKPAVVLRGHGRKVGHVLFNPVAENVLATTSADLTVRLWDVEKGVERQKLTGGHKDSIQSIAWNWNGTMVATHSRDKKLRIFDARSNQVVQEGSGHQGIKGARITFLGDTPRLASTGFSRSSERQLYVWDTANLSTPLKDISIDLSSGIIMPFYDSDCKVLYLAGKGDGNIRYYEFENDEMYQLAEYKSVEPQRGLAAMPKRGLNTSDCEIMRFYKVTTSLVEPVSFTVPRRSDAFQSDLYPPTPGDQPALTADQYFDGQTADPILITFDENYVYTPQPKEFIPHEVQADMAASPQRPKPRTVTERQPQAAPQPQPTRSTPPASAASVAHVSTPVSAPAPEPVNTPSAPESNVTSPKKSSPTPAAAAPSSSNTVAVAVDHGLQEKLEALQKEHLELKAAYQGQHALLTSLAERLAALEVSQKQPSTECVDSSVSAIPDAKEASTSPKPSDTGKAEEESKSETSEPKQTES
ncbi:Coronin-like protein crn1 [Dispira parvispora]|uniref:Coronin n=1 Tax=Dispira parvispora TaxID=1520584 RepID=A0A9W8AQL5_9FUNG|nr:Coronin-like protein crn1 [Dispira parvispora]